MDFHWLLKGWLNFLFPQFCLFCNVSLEKEASFLCSECSKVLVAIDHNKCCCHCGTIREHSTLCKEPFFPFKCLGGSVAWGLQVWDRQPDLPFLGHKQKAKEKEQLIERILTSLLRAPCSTDLLANALLATFLQRSWPIPDIIIAGHGKQRAFSGNQVITSREKNTLLASSFHSCLKKAQLSSQSCQRSFSSSSFSSFNSLSQYERARRETKSAKEVFWVAAAASHGEFIDWIRSNEWALEDRHYLVSLI